ncbi:uncharacterized protein MONBRDRAFT_13034 [Monosiga brevicollis MX1]|uniref:Uncharacterized protein n=1 Tax=Monosiga brevicollis TaxID=81824 RepID=A9VE55_MONBE|nr:uncharacterized protein MONBRDRAFT_13034 [Monosiga brevicollis MX1]EDQ84189.1 predicted protein [Monosiga brevicollis MX1]|eukprot:XP_001750977.1 hypothetical protein [Monosiga brevicollis MX1]
MARKRNQGRRKRKKNKGASGDGSKLHELRRRERVRMIQAIVNEVERPVLNNIHDRMHELQNPVQSATLARRQTFDDDTLHRSARDPIAAALVADYEWYCPGQLHRNGVNECCLNFPKRAQDVFNQYSNNKQRLYRAFRATGRDHVDEASSRERQARFKQLKLAEQSRQEMYRLLRSNPGTWQLPFSAEDIFTGDNYFLNTTLYIGAYTDETLRYSGTPWRMPLVYMLMVLGSYLFSALLLVMNMRNQQVESAFDLQETNVYQYSCTFRVAIFDFCF